MAQSRVIMELDALRREHRELDSESDLAGYGIQSAGQMLLKNWKAAIGNG